MSERNVAAHHYAVKAADDRFPPTGDIVTRSVAAFCLASLPGYLMLLFFGFRQESVEIPLLLAGCLGVAIVHLLELERSRNWRKTYKTACDKAMQEL